MKRKRASKIQLRFSLMIERLTGKRLMIQYRKLWKIKWVEKFLILCT